jgi:CubicO group peptidase (beta-lactamase class C family)
VPAGVRLEPLLDEVFAGDGPLGRTFAVVVVHRGRVVAERYAGTLERFDGPGVAVGPSTPLLSWSMAKSMLHAAVGILSAEGRLDLGAPAPVPSWRAAGDPRQGITLDHLLAMRDGLLFAEEYAEGAPSDVIEMLFGEGRHDVARFAADRPPAAAPGTRFSYSSGSSNIVSGVVARELGPGDPYRRFLSDRLFGPIGAASADPGFDDAGTWVASTFLHATARDFARFGLLYLRDGVFDGRRVLPEGWVDTARRARSVDPADGQHYANHWWVVADGWGTFAATGYAGQSVTVCPAADLVVVRLGETPLDRYPELRRWRASVVAAFATGGG